MAARKRTWTPDIVRKRIRAGVIARRLQDHALGKVEMSRTQVAAALGILKKAMPDLSATEITAELRTADISDKPLTADEWASQYSDLASPGGTSESVN